MSKAWKKNKYKVQKKFKCLYLNVLYLTLFKKMNMCTVGDPGNEIPIGQVQEITAIPYMTHTEREKKKPLAFVADQ